MFIILTTTVRAPFWLKNFGINIKALKKLGPKSLVKIWSVKAEIFLIWTNVACQEVQDGQIFYYLRVGWVGGVNKSN